MDVRVSLFVSGAGRYVTVLSTRHRCHCVIVYVRCKQLCRSTVYKAYSGASRYVTLLSTRHRCQCHYLSGAGRYVAVLSTRHRCQCVIVYVRCEQRSAARKKWKKKKWRQPSAQPRGQSPPTLSNLRNKISSLKKSILKKRTFESHLKMVCPISL